MPAKNGRNHDTGNQVTFDRIAHYVIGAIVAAVVAAQYLGR